MAAWRSNSSRANRARLTSTGRAPIAARWANRRMAAAALLVLCALTLGVRVGVCADAASAGSSPARPDALPLEQLLRPDGSLDLHGGYRGSVSAAGWRMTTDARGRPSFVRATGGAAREAWDMLTTTVPEDSCWDGVGDTVGFNSSVRALAVDGNGNLYAAGLFSTAPGVRADCIAKWNGSSWSALGTGMNDWVYALAVDVSGNLYAGGYFTTADGVSANYIAKWNGSSWSALDAGMNGAVATLALDGSGNLYAGGYFTMAGGVSANDIAMWNGSTWSALGSG